MTNILVLEDDKIQATNLQNLIERNIPNCHITVCENEQDAREKVCLIDFHIMIIDLILESGSGLEFSRWVRTIAKYQMTWIIIVTGHDSYALDAIRQIHCFDYILKPYHDDDMLKIIGKVLKAKIVTDSNASYLSVSSKGISFKIRLNEILYVEVNNKKMDMYTANKVYSISRYSLSKIKEQLPKGMFLQCHRSYIVNADKISAVESRGRDTFILMNNHDRPIPVGIRYKDLISW